MNKKYEYDAVLVMGTQLGTFAEFPFDSTAEFGIRKAIPVIATFDGHRVEMNLLPCGNNRHWLHVRKEIRTAIGKNEGDLVHITIEKNDSPKKPSVPDYLLWLLEDDPVMMRAFEKMPVSARKFWIGNMEETKNEDTKVEKINKFFDYLVTHYSG
jgi:hypothetical protein